MSTTPAVRDETLNGEPSREWLLEVVAENVTIRELIRSRVYQEVQDYNLTINLKRSSVFQGLVQPDEAENALNGWTLKKPRMLDWKQQFDRAVEAFDKNQILILINDRQADSLDEESSPRPTRG
jgi:hypothetical protein